MFHTIIFFTNLIIRDIELVTECANSLKRGDDVNAINDHY